MAPLTRYLLFVFLAVALCAGGWVCSDARVAQTRPPVMLAQMGPNPPGDDYAPPTYTLGAPLNRPVSFDVDEYGRLYVVDPGRFAVMVFAPNGALEAVWRDGDFGENVHVVRHRVDVVASDVVFLSGPSEEAPVETMNVLRISPYEPNAVSVLPDGRYCGPVLGRPDRGYYELYNDDEIKFHAPDGSEISSSPTGFKADPYNSPAGVDAEGNVCLFDQETSTIHVWNRIGQKVREIRLPSHGVGLPGRYERVTVDADGSIYATAGFWIWRFDPQGKVISAFATWTPRANPEFSAHHPFISQADVRNGILYALCMGQSSWNSMKEIQAFATDGRCVARYLFPQPQFNCPNALAVQSDGSFAVGQNSITADGHGFILSPKGERVAKIDGEGVGRLLALPGGSYYTTGYPGLRKISSSGKATEVITEHIPDNNGGKDVTSWPALGDHRWVISICPYPLTGGVCVLAMSECDPVTFYQTEEIRVLDGDAKLIRTIPIKDNNYAGAKIAADTLGNIYMAIGEYTYSEVRKYNTQGELLGKIDAKGWQLGQLQKPEGVLTDDAGNLLVLDTGNSRIQAFSTNLEPLGVWGKLGGGDGELDHPRDMCFGPNNTLWIADTRNDRIVWIPLERFWRELTRNVAPPAPPTMLAKRESLPKNGQVALNGVITSDSKDGAVYAQHATGSWGVRLQLPKGLSVARGKSYQIAGNLIAKNGDNLVTAKSLTPIKQVGKTRPISLANACLAKPGKSSAVQSGVLVATWGQVTSIDKAGRAFTVSDGSMGKGGVKVGCGRRLKGIVPVKVGEYVALTGVAVRSGAGHGVQIQNKFDVRSLGMVKPEAENVACAMVGW